jgi:hypothetical protein
MERQLRYFFHFLSEGTFHKDTTGDDFSSIDAAIAHVRVIAAELRVGDPDYQSLAISVTDENGNEVARVAVGGPSRPVNGS